MTKFRQTSGLETPRHFPELLAQEAAEHGFKFSANFSSPNGPEWKGTLIGDKCRLDLQITRENNVVTLEILSSKESDESYEIPELKFIYTGSGYWEFYFLGFRNDWLAWLLCEFAEKGRSVLIESRKLAEEALEQHN
jgi:hypothetical protein